MDAWEPVGGIWFNVTSIILWALSKWCKSEVQANDVNVEVKLI